MEDKKEMHESEMKHPETTAEKSKMVMDKLAAVDAAKFPWGDLMAIVDMFETMDDMPMPHEAAYAGMMPHHRRHEHMMRSETANAPIDRYEMEKKLCETKERIGAMIGEQWKPDCIRNLVLKEAASLIKKLSENEDYEAIKEFTELTMAMRGFVDRVSVDIEDQAKMEAVAGYAKWFVMPEAEKSYRSRMMPEHEYAGRRDLPLINIEDFRSRR